MQQLDQFVSVDKPQWTPPAAHTDHSPPGKAHHSRNRLGGGSGSRGGGMDEPDAARAPDAGGAPPGAPKAHARGPAAPAPRPGGGRAAAGAAWAPYAWAALHAGLALYAARLLMYVKTAEQDLFFLYYQPLAPLLAMLWLWAAAVAYFERRRMRYDAAFAPEDARRLLPAAALFRVANFATAAAGGSAAAFLFNCARGAPAAAAAHPPLLYGGALALLLAPGDAAHGDARRLLAATAWRVATPVRAVSWADFLLADVLTSLAKALSDVERAVCHMATGDAMRPPAADDASCGDASWLIPAGLAAPYAWRLAQCVRVWRDTGNRAQLWNALKYSTAFPVIALSSVRYHVDYAAWRSTWRPAWLAAALANSAYSYWWDVERDWEVGLFSRMSSAWPWARPRGADKDREREPLAPGAAGGHAGAHAHAAQLPVLPPGTTFRRPFYLYLLASNAALRLSWAYKLSPHLRRHHAAVAAISVAEAVRRAQWALPRVEVELRRLQRARPEGPPLLPPPVGEVELPAAAARRAHHQAAAD